MVSTKGAALGTAVVAFLGWGIQLGALASWNSYACRSNASITQLAVPTTTGRRLLEVSESEQAARCSFSLAADWWTVFYQFAIVVAALFTARNDASLTRTRTRVGILFSIAIVWVVIRVSAVLQGAMGASPLAVQNALRDAGVTEKDYKDSLSALGDTQQYGLYTSERAYCAGGVISAIAYFLYIVLVLAEEEVASAKAAEADEAA